MTRSQTKSGDEKNPTSLIALQASGMFPSIAYARPLASAVPYGLPLRAARIHTSAWSRLAERNVTAQLLQPPSEAEGHRAEPQPTVPSLHVYFDTLHTAQELKKAGRDDGSGGADVSPFNDNIFSDSVQTFL